MSDLRQAASFALSTLQGWSGHGHWCWPESALAQAKQNTAEAIPLLEAALAEPEPKSEPEPVAWMYQGEPSFDGTDWQETWEVTMDKRLAEFKATPDQPIPLFSIQPQRQ